MPTLPPKVKGMWRRLMREAERSQKQGESA